jgi:hypothetical protein
LGTPWTWCQNLTEQAFLGPPAVLLSWKKRRKALENLKPGLFSDSQTLTSAKNLFVSQSCGTRAYYFLIFFYELMGEGDHHIEK